MDGKVDSGLRDRIVGNCCLHISFRVMEDNPGGDVTKPTGKVCVFEGKRE